MIFEKYAPSKHLAHLIDYFWTLRSETNEQDSTYRFVPDGFVDWVFHIGTPWSFRFPDSTTVKQTNRFHVFGQIKRHVDLNISSGRLDLFGVKFFPWSARLIWKVDMHYLTDSCDDLLNLDMKRMAELQDRLMMAKDTHQRVELTENYLESFAHFKTDETLKPILMLMHFNRDLELKQEFGFGLRRLEQRFKAEIGISPKLFGRTLRLNRLIQEMRGNTQVTLTQMALEADFYDQAHFIKDFKKFTGYSPRQFLNAINPNGDILNLRAS